MSRIMALILATCLVSPVVFAQATQPASTTPSGPYPIDPSSGSTKPTPANSGGKSVPVAAPPDAATDAKAEASSTKVTGGKMSSKDMTAMMAEMKARSDREFAESMPVSPEIMAAMLQHKVDPIYPGPAARAHQGATVVYRAVINQEGRVVTMKLVSGPSEFTDFTVRALNQYRYKPYLQDGKPVAVNTTITVNFTPPN